MKAYIKFLDIYIKIAGNHEWITSISFVGEEGVDNFDLTSEVSKARKQIIEYLNKERKAFTLNLFLQTTPFQQAIYEELIKVSYGTTITYKDLGDKANYPKAARAVGNAMNKNQFVIVIPCHRVIGSNSQLGGFAPGIKYKEYLMQLEGSI